MPHSDFFHQILYQYWGYNFFRPLQEEVIQSVWKGKDTLGLMPTGGGKSLTFQVPTMAMKGICLVVTPLIALMKDQVDNLRARGIKAAAVYSGMSRQQIIGVLENCIFGDFKFLYVSPERLFSELFLTKLRAMNVCLLVVDEAHCISQWGYDFRPSYLKISEIRETLPRIPILALTATATQSVAKDIQKKLLFKRENIFRKSFKRNNLSYVARFSENKHADLVRILTSVSGTAIVYVRSRKQTIEIAAMLKRHHIDADFFHAGISHEEKTYRQNAWKTNECRVMVSTNAFGMGIDKPDVRIVVHLDLPNSLEEYYQEAGRAGRDGKKAYAVILHNKSDSAKLKKRIADAFPPRTFVLRVYEALGNYYEVAVNSGFQAVFDFNLYDFCTRFKFPLLPTHHALKILELSGYIEYTEEIEMCSRIQFLVLRDELYSLPLERQYDELLHLILRTYTGVFSNEVYIEESFLARHLGKTSKEIYEMLKSLGKQRVIRYVPQKKTPFIVFSTAREENSFVSISKAVYEERKSRFSKRIKSMIDYVENNSVCRSRVLLLYFDERRAHNCGVCDVCLKYREKPLKVIEKTALKEEIIGFLDKRKSCRIHEFVRKLANNKHREADIIETIRCLADEGVLQITKDEVQIIRN